MYIIVSCFIITVYLIWRFGTRNFDYWKKKGVKHEAPVLFFGNMYRMFTQRTCFSQQIREWCEKFPEEKYVGVHMANDLGLVLRDPEMIKSVFVTDFQYFHERGMNSHKHVREPLYYNLFTADGDIWKLVRQRITPAFSSAKLKAMFPLIEKATEKMLLVTKAGTQDVKELMARYSIDFIGTCGFGLDFDTLNDENSMFRRLGRRVFKLTARDALVHLVKRVAPELFKHVNYFAAEIETNTLKIVNLVLKDRNYKPSGRNDFVDLLLEVQQNGKMTGKSLEHFNPDGTPKAVEIEFDDVLLAAQAFTFLTAGFETSSSSTSFLLHELAFDPEVQERCHREIDEVLSKHNGKICYEAVKEMKYLEMAFRESQRVHPSPSFIIRRCVKKYTFPGTTLTIDEGVYILVSLTIMHKDPRFFQDPETFKPDRFANEIDNVQKCVYMPFGEGPRSCIGERLGLFQSLAGVAALLSRFRVEPAPTTRRQPIIDPQSFFVDNILGGLPLTLVRRDKTTNL